MLVESELGLLHELVEIGLTPLHFLHHLIMERTRLWQLDIALILSALLCVVFERKFGHRALLENIIQIFGTLLVFLQLSIVQLFNFVNQSAVSAIQLLLVVMQFPTLLLPLLLFALRVCIYLLFDIVPLLMQSLGCFLVYPLHFVLKLLHVHAAGLCCV